VHAGGTLVRLGRLAERLRAGGEHLGSGCVRLGRMALGRFHSLAGSGGPVLNGVPVSFPELLEPRPDGLKPSVDLSPATWLGPGLAVHASSMPDSRKHSHVRLDQLCSMTSQDDTLAGRKQSLRR